MTMQTKENKLLWYERILLFSIVDDRNDIGKANDYNSLVTAIPLINWWELLVNYIFF